MSLSSVIRYVRALDSAATDGSGKTGIAFGSITAKYLVQGGTLTALTTENVTTLGTYQAPSSASHIRIRELANTDPTKGIYEVHFHNTQVDVAGKKLWLFLSASEAAFAPIEVDLTDVNSRLPAALTGDGNIKADMRAIAAAPVAVDTGTAGTVSFVSGEFVATSGGTVNANVVQIDGENVVSDGNGRLIVQAATLASGAIQSSTFATGAIDAAAIATDAISSAEIAAAAVTEIQAGLSTLSSAAVAAAVWNATRASYVSAGTFGEGVPVSSLGAGAITSSTIADGAITSAKFTVQTLTGVASGILEKIAQVWHWFFGAVELTDVTMKTKTGDTVLTTQAVSYDGVTETRGAAE